MKPIQQAFKLVQASVCLANEWRDTITYTSGLVIATVATIDKHPIALTAFVILAGGRELVRSENWEKSGKEILVDFDVQPNSQNNFYAARFMAISSLAVGSFSLGVIHNSFDLGISAVCAFFATLRLKDLSDAGIKLKNIPALYFDKNIGMWDWPRKCGGNGPTHTDKLKEAFRNGKNYIGKWLVAPKPQLNYVPTHRLNSIEP